MKITFDVKNQILSRTDRQNVIANSTDYLEAEVTFTEDWNDLEKNMQFVSGDNVVTMTLTEDDGKWVITQNQHLNLGIGTWKVSIIGVGGDTRIVTNAANLAIRASGYIGVGGPLPNIYEQLLTIIQSLHTEAASSAVIRSAVQQYITDNFDALVKDVVIVGDVQEIIDEMVEDGTISALLDQVVAGDVPDAVEAWLTDHVDPDTGYVIDNTLTTALAAADAKAAGDAISSVRSALTTFEGIIVESKTVTNYEQVDQVTKHDGYVWSTNTTKVSNILIAQNNRQAVEFAAKPSTKYVIQGTNVGVSQNYGIGFFANSTDQDSTSVLYTATQETWNDYERCTLFTTPADCNYIRYICYPNASYDQQLEGTDTIVYEVKESVVPDTIQRSSDNSLGTTDKTIVGAINEVKGMVVGVSSVPWVVAPDADPSTDMTSAILACLTAYGICQLMGGTYLVTDLDMPVESTLLGIGKGTTILLSGTDSTQGYAIKMATGCAVKSMRIIGSTESISLASTLVNRHGILWEGTYSADQNAPHKGSVENVWIENFKGGGITLRDTGTPVNNCLNVTDAYIEKCRAGINVAYSAEFNRFENVHCYGCYYGAINNGGNNTFVGCSFSSNTVGFRMGAISGETLTNVQHGSAIGCVINHSHANDGNGIEIVGGSTGFVFSGCQMFYSKIDLDSTSGILFDGFNFGTQTITAKDCSGAILFTNCLFGSAPTINKSNSDHVVFANCYTRAGAAVSG